jgi:hypothetical protein
MITFIMMIVGLYIFYFGTGIMIGEIILCCGVKDLIHKIRVK